MRIQPANLDTVAGLAPAQTILRNGARATMLAALRRCQGDALERGAWTGRALDPRALPFAACRPAMFRTEHATGIPEIGLAVIVDASGSMEARLPALPGCAAITRLQAANAVALGIADAARALRLPVALLHHSCTVTAHRTASGFAATRAGGTNRDAVAVRSAHRAYGRFARRILSVLVCDGSPCVDDASHRATAAQVRAEMARAGDAMLGLLIVEDSHAARRMAQDWGARATALATRPLEVARATAHAVAAMR